MRREPKSGLLRLSNTLQEWLTGRCSHARMIRVTLRELHCIMLTIDNGVRMVCPNVRSNAEGFSTCEAGTQACDTAAPD